MLLLLLCASLTVTAARYEETMWRKRDVVMATAVSAIMPNTKPPPGTETPVVGTVWMKQIYGQKTFFAVEMSGLPPNSNHGFHIHEFGDIITDGCQSTGGHYNPFNHTHGAPTDAIRHIGDLGNLFSDVNGRISKQFMDEKVSLFGPFSVIGRAFVIHQKRDDLGHGTGPARKESLITGNAGARLGCGVICHAACNISPPGCALYNN